MKDEMGPLDEKTADLSTADNISSSPELDLTSAKTTPSIASNSTWGTPWLFIVSCSSVLSYTMLKYLPSLAGLFSIVLFNSIEFLIFGFTFVSANVALH